jgi:cell division septum initiation protein DivIVA
VVNQLQQSLSYTDSPLTSSQGDQVAQILANTGPQHSTSSANSDNTSTEPNKTNSRITNATIAQAQGVLQPSQVQALQEIQAQQQAVAQLKKIMRQNSNNNPSAAISGTATTIGGK